MTGRVPAQTLHAVRPSLSMNMKKILIYLTQVAGRCLPKHSMRWTGTEHGREGKTYTNALWPHMSTICMRAGTRCHCGEGEKYRHVCGTYDMGRCKTGSLSGN